MQHSTCTLFEFLCLHTSICTRVQCWCRHKNPANYEWSSASYFYLNKRASPWHADLDETLYLKFCITPSILSVHIVVSHISATNTRLHYVFTSMGFLIKSELTAKTFNSPIFYAILQKIQLLHILPQYCYLHTDILRALDTRSCRLGSLSLWTTVF